MKLNKFFFTILLFFLIASCSSKKNILYVQDIDEIYGYSVKFNQYEIQVDDILRIDVSSDNPEANIIFMSNINNLSANSKETLVYNGYQVNSSGFIYFPIIGKIKAEGKTIEQIRNEIFNLIIDNEILINPFVDVKLLNTHFTILGEVLSPGRYEYIKNNLNILEAIGMAGDLTINGDRKEIKILRDLDSKTKIFNIDITNTNFIKNSGFQIISGDIIIVNPNSNRVKNAGVIGNSGTLLSLLSFILSSIIVISNS